MGCAASNVPVINPDDKVMDSKDKTANKSSNNDEVVKYPPPEAFEVFIENNTDDSLVKKHPPKRLQRLQGETQSSSPTIEELTAKLANAELRRQQYLMEKIGGPKPLRDQRDSNSSPDDGRPVTAEFGDREQLSEEKIHL